MLVADAREIVRVVQDIFQLAKGDGWGQFLEGYPMAESAKSIPAPVITWRSVLEQPAKVGDRVQIKPKMATENINPERGEGVQIYTQPIESYLRFGVWHTNLSSARNLARELEEIMLIYAGYIMSTGAATVLWLQTTTDAPETDRWRTDLVPVFVDYQVRLLKYTTVRTAIVEAVNVRVRQIAESSSTLRRLLEEGTQNV